MKRGLLIGGLMLMSVAASPKQLAFERYNPANKREEPKPAKSLPSAIFLYSNQEFGFRRAKQKENNGYKPMPLREGGLGKKPQASGIGAGKRMPPRIPSHFDARRQQMYGSAAHGRRLC